MEHMNMNLGSASITDLLGAIYKCKQKIHKKMGVTLPNIPKELRQDIARVLKPIEVTYDDLWDIVQIQMNEYTKEEALKRFISTEGLIHNFKYPDIYIQIDLITEESPR